MFYKTFISLCESKNIKPSAAAAKMGFNKSTVSAWKRNNSVPNREILEKIADYFQVSVDFLLGKTENPNDYILSVDNFPSILQAFVSGKEPQLIVSVDGKFSERITQEEFKNAMVEKLKNTQVRFDPTDRNPVTELMALLLDNLRDQQMSMYDLLKYISRDPEIMQKLKDSGYNERGELTIPPEEFDRAALSSAIKDTLKNKKSSDKKSELPIDTIPYVRGRRLPILGSIPAGIPVLASENIQGYAHANVPEGEDYFFLQVKGESMINARIFNGDLVLIKSQTTADNGDIVVCIVNGDEATLKRFRRGKNAILLIPENPEYQPIMVSLKEFENGYARIIGVAKEVRHKL